jgi:hypothetical protein
MRDESAAGKEESQRLIWALLPYAQQMLWQSRGFAPFGGTVSADGQIEETAAGAPGVPVQAQIELLLGAFKIQAARAEIRACAVVYRTRAAPPGFFEPREAVAFVIEHVSGYAVNVIFPYAFSAGGKLRIETPFASKGTSTVFERTEAA